MTGPYRQAPAGKAATAPLAPSPLSTRPEGLEAAPAGECHRLEVRP